MRKAAAAQQPPALVLPPLRPRDARAQPPAAKAVPLLDAFVVPDCLSASECAALVAAATPGLTLATSRGPRHGEALRRHGRAELSSPAYAAQLWARLRPALAAALPAATGLSPRLRLYRYAPGDVFGPHWDESSALLAEEDGRRLTTLYTVLFYINGGDVQGGETVFFADGDEARELCRVPPTPGSALVFRQGARGMLHSCGAIRAGTKWVLRTDLAFPA